MAKGIKDFTKVLGLVRDVVMGQRQGARPNGFTTKRAWMVHNLLDRGWRVPAEVVGQALEALVDEGWLAGEYSMFRGERYYHSRTDEERAAWLAQEERAKKAARRLKALGVTAEVDGGEEDGGEVKMTVAALERLLDAAEKGKEVVK